MLLRLKNNNSILTTHHRHNADTSFTVTNYYSLIKEEEATVLNRQFTYYLQGMTKRITVVVLISFLNQEASYFV